MKKLFLLLFLLNQIVVAQEKDVITPGANLVVEGIPPIPAMVAAQMKPYTESRAATFCAWHPEKREMLIATRFANVPQLHWVKLPLGARKQLTFFDEPVTNASFDPVNGDYFLFNRDAGGNEFTQIYLFDVKNGKTSLLTDGKRSQNMGIRWNNAGNRIAYSSTSRNGADRDLYVMNPRDPAGNKMVLQVEGGGWSVLDWSPDDKQLLVFETISVNESYYWLLDLATGTKTELSNRKEKGIAFSYSSF